MRALRWKLAGHVTGYCEGRTLLSGPSEPDPTAVAGTTGSHMQLTHDHAESRELLSRGASHLVLQTRSCSAMAGPAQSNHLFLIQCLERNDPWGHQLRRWRLGLVTPE